MEPGEYRRLAIAEIDAVYRLAYYLCNQAHEADDAVQETYLRAFKAGDGFTLTEHGLRPWLFRILHNVVIARGAKQKQQPSLMSEFDGIAQGGSHDEHPAPMGATGIDWEHIDERLKRAIGELPLSYRTAFLLCAVEDLKYREIAEIMEAPIGTIMTHIFRARATLAARLQGLAAEHGLPAERKFAFRKSIHPPEGSPPND